MLRVAATLGLVVAVLAVSSLAGAAPSSRFFFSGDGALDLYNAHSTEHLAVRYRDAGGHYDSAALGQIEQFFRSRSDGQRGPISLRLIELIDFVQDRFRPRRLTLVSAYRSPDFNQALRSSGHRVAQASLHTEGMAADLQPAGIDLRRLWLQLRGLQTGGVGLYQADGFIHLDTGPPRFWEAATSGVEKNLSADNARLFARTDFDRYDDLRGATIRLHAVTALPISIERNAYLGDRPLPIAPATADWSTDGECYVINDAADQYTFVISGSATPFSERLPIRLRTCAPRIGATPETILSNSVQRLP